MAILYTDTHAHLERLGVKDDAACADGAASHEILAALFAGGFGNILDIGTDHDDVLRRIVQFSRYDNVRFAAGIWPTQEAVTEREAHVSILREQVRAAPAGSITAIGECGLDHHAERHDKDGERELFEAQLDLAAELDLPIIVHSRDAPLETLDILRAKRDVRGIIHCYSYGIEEARQFLDLGYHISFAGNITYKKSDAIRAALCFVPDDRLLLETDSPFLAPQSRRGQPCTPAFIAETYAAAAQLRGVSIEYLASLISINAKKLLFNFKNSLIQK